jgi:hypothetical protein
VIPIDDLLTVTQVTRGGTVVPSTEYQLYPLNRGNGPATKIVFRGDSSFNELVVLTPSSWYGYPYKGMGVGQIAITGTWGYCTLANRPVVVKEATLMLAEVLVERIAFSTKARSEVMRDPIAAMNKDVMRVLQEAGLIKAAREATYFG